MLRPESLATEASRVSRADADGAGGTDASPAPFAFRRVAITPPDGFANSRRARADLVALRKSVTLQRGPSIHEPAARRPSVRRPAEFRGAPDAGAIVLLGAKVPPDRFVEIAESV